jgi:nitroreductase
MADRATPSGREAAATPDRDFFDVVLSQRAHRAVLTDPVPDETIARVLDAATHAPSAENRQPWVFVVVRDPEVRTHIGRVAARIWEHAGRAHSRGRISDGLLAAVERWAMGGLAQAPVIVVACGDTSVSDPRSLAASVFPAAQNLCLAAHALGLGSLFSTLPTVDPELGTLLGLPDHLHPMAVIPLGLPARRLRPPKRISFREKTYRDRYGNRW